MNNQNVKHTNNPHSNSPNFEVDENKRLLFPRGKEALCFGGSEAISEGCILWDG